MDEWKIEIKAGSLNYTAQRSSCCGQNGAACNRCTANRAKRFATCHPSHLLVQSNWTGFRRITIRPTLSQTFDLASRANYARYRNSGFIGNIAANFPKFRIVSYHRVYERTATTVLWRRTKVIKTHPSLREEGTWISRIT